MLPSCTQILFTNIISTATGCQSVLWFSQTETLSVASRDATGGPLDSSANPIPFYTGHLEDSFYTNWEGEAAGDFLCFISYNSF